MALEPLFLEGIDRVIAGSKQHRVALVCSEHNPLDCHRCLLVGRNLSEHQLPLKHILSSGRVVTQEDIENHLLETSGGAEDDLFLPRALRLNKAYQRRAKSVAYRIDRYYNHVMKSTGRYNHAQ